VTLCVAPTELRLSSAEATTGETVDRLHVTSSFQFPALTLHFRGGYLLEALTRIRGDATLSFSKIGATMGLWITHATKDGESFEYVLMGIRAQS
jgi:hypothetical protein